MKPRKIKKEKWTGKLILKPLAILLILMFGVICIGTAGFMFLEKMSFIEAFFLTVITISTVGYSSPNLSDQGMIFTMVVIAGGISIVLYGVTAITGAVVEGKLGTFMKFRRNRKMISKLSGHIIVVGAGKTGKYVVSELIRESEDLVLIDLDEQNIKRTQEITGRELNYVVGNAVEEDILLSANITRAKALICTLSKDSLNVFVVLSAKTLNPNLNIISRVSDISTIKKVKYAGATSVVADAEISGVRMARIASNPEAVDFLDVVSLGGEEYRIEEITIKTGSSLIDKTLAELNLSKSTGVMVIAIRKNNITIFGPTGIALIEENDKLVLLGKIQAILKVREIAK